MIPEEAVEAAARAWVSHSLKPGSMTLEDGMRDILEAAAPHMLAGAIEQLAEARNENDTLFIFSWGQRDWMRRHAVDIRTRPTPWARARQLTRTSRVMGVRQ